MRPIYLIVILFCLVWTSVQGGIKKEYTTKCLAEIDNNISSAKHEVRYVSDDIGRVCHIGYKLFADSLIETSHPHVLLPFIERYFLELDLKLGYHTPINRMRLDKVQLFLNGEKAELDWETIIGVLKPNIPFVINSKERKKYNISWETEIGEVSMSVPMDYQILSGSNIIELEENFMRDVQLEEARLFDTKVDSVAILKESTDVIMSDSLIVVRQGEYISNLIRKDLYIIKDIEGDWYLKIDSISPRQSVLNILATGQFIRPLPVNFIIKQYGSKYSSSEVSMQQLISFLRNEGCQPYIGIKRMNSETAEATIFAYNSSGSYTHVIRVLFPLELLGEVLSENKIQAEGYLYIPLNYVNESFFRTK